MIHTTTTLVKFKKLHRRLGFSKVRETVGLLESMWAFTQRNCQRGDIGKFDDESIAIELEWDGDPGELVMHLVETGWLDKHPVYRLIIHDWHLHAPNYLKANLKSHGRVFVSEEEQPAMSSPPEQPAIAPCQSSLPKQGAYETKPNETKPNQTKPAALPPSLQTPEAEKALSEWLEYHPKYKPIALQKLLTHWGRAGPAAFCAAVEHSMMNGYKGLYSPSGGKPNEEEEEQKARAAFLAMGANK